MFNIQAGQGLGFGGSKQIALGLGGIVPAVPVPSVIPGGFGGDGWRMRDWRAKRDREILRDDEICLEFIATITPTLH